MHGTNKSNQIYMELINQIRMDKIEIKKETVISAYKNANKEEKEFLEHMFGGDIFKQLNVQIRIKTFKDALDELHSRSDNGDNHAKILIDEYNYIARNYVSCDLLAYCKLRIITEALNEGWKPKFNQGEKRFYPNFRLQTKEELELQDNFSIRIVGRGGYSALAYSGLAYAYADHASSYSDTSYGSRLTFKDQKLAEYAGNQFIELYAEYCFNPLNI